MSACRECRVRMSQVRVARAQLTRLARRAAAKREPSTDLLHLLDDAKTVVSREVSAQLRHENECQREAS